jgi:transposase
MARPLVPDELWEIVEPLLPKPKRRRFRYPGRKPVDRRKALTGIVFVLKTGIPWEDVPSEMGVSGVSCWRKLREWQSAGVWDRLVEVLLAKLRHADKINWERAVVDSSSVRAVAGGKKTGPSPVDRRKAGSKHHILVDAEGTPLSGRVTKANRNDVTQLEALVDAVPPVHGKVGRPRQRPDELYGDRAYDSKAKREALRERGIRPFLARRKTAHGSGLGRRRWVVERSLSWLHQFRRLRTRFDRSAKIHQAFLTLGIALVCWNVLN